MLIFPEVILYLFFNLIPDLSDGPHFDLIRRGNIWLEAHFERNLAVAVTCLVHAEYDSVIKTDKTEMSPIINLFKFCCS